MQLMTLFQKIFDLSVEEDVNWTAFWLVMIRMYINIGLYIMDLYALVKKKTLEETALIMVLPSTIIGAAATVITLYLQIPASPYLEKVWREVVSPGLWIELLFVAALFVVFWGLAWGVDLVVLAGGLLPGLGYNEIKKRS